MIAHVFTYPRPLPSLTLLLLLLACSSWFCAAQQASIALPSPPRVQLASIPRPIRRGESFSEVIVPHADVSAVATSDSKISRPITGDELKMVYLHPSAAAVAGRKDNVFMKVSPDDTTLTCTDNGAASTCPQFSPCSPSSGDSIQSCGSSGLMPGDDLAAKPWSFRELCVRNISPSEERYMLEGSRMMPSQCPFQSLMSLKRQVFKWKNEFLSLPDAEEARAAEEEEANRGAPLGPFEEWAGQVFLLHDVFVDRWGRVFNRTHFFHAGRCSDTSRMLSFPPGSKVTEMDELFNLMVDSEDRWYTELAEKLPLFLPLVPFLGQLRKTPVLVSNRQRERRWWEVYVGVQVAGPTVTRVASNALLRVKKLYLPLFQPCGKPSAALWHTLRSQHLLPPQGLPIIAESIAGVSPSPVEPTIFPNMSAPLAPEDWVVVVAHPPLSASSAEEFRAMTAAARLAGRILRRMFGRERVVYYKALPPRETRQLFNRALLLVGCGNRLVNTIFMPFVSAVLELQYTPTPHSSHPLFPSSPYPKSGTTLYRDLAIASGVKHYSLDCSVTASDVAAPCGGKENIHVALEGVTRDIFASHAFSRSLTDRSGMGFADRIPGTPLQSTAAVKRFRAWQHCVATKGKWVKDNTPRRLPWMYNGHYAICEYKHRERGGMAIHAADSFAERWLNFSAKFKTVKEEKRREWEKRWDVREAVKYKWEAEEKCGRWEPFSAERLCSLGKMRDGERSINILIVGDSLQGQLVSALVNNIAVPFQKPADVNETTVAECDRWMEGHKASKARFCQSFRMSKPCADSDTLINIKYIRNDLLFISSHDHTSRFLPWNRMLPTIQWADAIVLNRGAHYSMDMAFRTGVRSALRHLRIIAPEKLVIVRNTSPGHANCTEYTEPITKIQDPESLPFNWGKFRLQNPILKEEVEGIGGVYMDIYHFTSLRADGHCGRTLSGKMDCLHYCFPGPPDTWAQLLMNILLELLEKERRQVA